MEGISTATMDKIANARRPASTRPYAVDDATAVSDSNVNIAAVTSALLHLLEAGSGGGYGVGGSSRAFANFESSLDASFRSWGEASPGLSSMHAMSDKRAASLTTAAAAERYATLATLRLLAALQPESSTAGALSHADGWSKPSSPADLLSKALFVAKVWTRTTAPRGAVAAAEEEVQEEEAEPATTGKPTGELVCAVLAAAAMTGTAIKPQSPSAACAATAIDTVVTMVYNLVAAARGAEREDEGEEEQEAEVATEARAKLEPQPQPVGNRCQVEAEESPWVATAASSSAFLDHDDALAADALATLAVLLEHCADEVAHATRAALEAACGVERAYTLGLALKCGVRGTPLHALLSRTHCGNRAAAAVALEG